MLSGNVQSLIVPLILLPAGGLAVILKIYAGLPLAILGRWRSLVAAAAIIVATIPVLPWSTYISEFALISQRLADQSKLTLPMGFLLLVSPLVVLSLLVVGRERAAWLVVPAIWPSQQFYYGTIALPARSKVALALIALPVPGNGLLALGALALVTWSNGDRGLLGSVQPAAGDVRVRGPDRRWTPRERVEGAPARTGVARLATVDRAILHRTRPRAASHADRTVSSSTRWSLVVAGESLLLLFLLRFGTTLFADSVQHPVQLVILAVLGGIGWLVVLVRPNLLPTLLVVAPLPILASVAVTSISSPYPSLSGWATWQSAAYVGIAWLLAIQASHPVGRRNLIAVLAIVVTIVIAYYLFVVTVAWSEWLANGFPLTSVPLRPDYTGGWVFIPAWLADVVVLCVPVVSVSLWQRGARIPAVVLIGSGLLAIALSGTRSVLLLVVAVAALGAGVLIGNHGDRRAKVLSGLGLVAVVVLATSLVLMARDGGLAGGRSSSIASAIDRFVASPVVGSGPGTYGVERMSDPVDTLFNLAQADALNVVLTSASDSGIVGLVGLGLSVAAYVIASRRAWRRTPTGRPIIVAASIGVVVFAGHSLGEFVFGLIGSILLLIAVVSIAATDDGIHEPAKAPRPRWLSAGLVAGILVIVISSVVLLKNEMTRSDLATAEGLIESSPNAALAASWEATDKSPDSVPAWWVRMVAADAAGETEDSIAAARRTVELEGFGQEWLSLAILLDRAGDAVGARDAVDHAVASTVVDPLVELNAAIFYDKIGADTEAKVALSRLLQARADIEPALATTLPQLNAIARAVRGDAARAVMESGDASTAFLIALAGEDRDLAAVLQQQVAARDPVAGEYWRTITAAWFGDADARAATNSQALAHPTGVSLAWAWRMAVRACDPSAAYRWERAIHSLEDYWPSMPIAIGTSPDSAWRPCRLATRHNHGAWTIRCTRT